MGIERGGNGSASCAASAGVVLVTLILVVAEYPEVAEMDDSPIGLGESDGVMKHNFGALKAAAGMNKAMKKLLTKVNKGKKVGPMKPHDPREYKIPNFVVAGTP